MRRNGFRAAALAAALAFCGLALPGCPDYGHDDNSGVNWAIGFNADLIPGDGHDGGGFTAVIIWDW